jgi:hypothetical protein
MALKPDGREIVIREQMIEDLPSGLTLMFERMPSGLAKLSIFGDLPYCNREIIFDKEGREAGGGTCFNSCRPSWLRQVKD